MITVNPNLPKCFKFGILGNVFFMAFSIICFAYYSSFKYVGDLPIMDFAFQIIAYAAEATGFILMLLAMIWFSKTVRQRYFMKTMFCIYILVELVLMVFELNSQKLDFYKPYSLALAIGHSIFSALVCFTFLVLDPKRTALEGVIVASVAIVLVGMIGNIIGYRIYFSILTNAVAFAVMFGLISFFISQEKIEIDCYGDKARVIEYRSDFFD